MARILGSKTKPASSGGAATNREFVKVFASILEECGFVKEFDNTGSVLSYKPSNATLNLTNWKVLHNTTLEEVTQIRLRSPCGKFKILFFLGPTGDHNYPSDYLSCIILRNAGTGTVSSLVGSSSIDVSTVSANAQTTATWYNQTAQREVSYEIIKKNNSFSVVVENYFAACYYQLIPLVPSAGLPGAFFFNIKFQTNSEWLEKRAAGTGNTNTAVNCFHALSDNLLTTANMQATLSPYSRATYLLTPEHVDVETVLTPAIWTNNGLYKLEGMYWGASKIAPSALNGIIVLNNKNYYVIKASTACFLCFEV